MQIEARVTKQIEVKSVRVSAAVRYEEEDIPNDAPMRKGDMWNATIDIDTGIIEGWPIGKTLDMHMKVTDCGSYYLLDADGRQVASRESEYVPGFFPGQHYGDYLILDIDANGKIANWRADPGKIAAEFFPED